MYTIVVEKSAYRSVRTYFTTMTAEFKERFPFHAIKLNEAAPPQWSFENLPMMVMSKPAAISSGTGLTTAVSSVRKSQLRSRRVGRWVLIKWRDLEDFMEANTVEAIGA